MPCSPRDSYLRFINSHKVKNRIRSSDLCIPTIHTSTVSVTQSCLTLCDPMDCSMSGFPVHHQLWSLLKLMSIGLMMPTKHAILSHPLLLLSSVFPSIRVFSNESALHIKWPKYWSFSFGISPPSEYSGLISFRVD